MSLPMFGNWVVEVKAVRPYAIHGDLYYELHVARTDDPTPAPAVLRVPQHATPGMPAVGQVLNVTFLMGQVTAAQPVA